MIDVDHSRPAYWGCTRLVVGHLFTGSRILVLDEELCVHRRVDKSLNCRKISKLTSRVEPASYAPSYLFTFGKAMLDWLRTRRDFLNMSALKLPLLCLVSPYSCNSELFAEKFIFN